MEDLGIDDLEIDIRDLKHLTNLINLSLNNTTIINIKEFSNLVNLESLYLYDVALTDVSFLQSLTNLTSLSLIGNEITDMSFLQNLTNLESLSLASNGIKDISILSNLTNLTNLNLYNNNITDISALSNLTNLTNLNLSSNYITDFSPIENMQIETLDIENQYKLTHGENENFKYDIEDDNTLTITGYKGTDTEIQIPNEIDGRIVKKIYSIGINDDAEVNGSMTKLIIPSSVTEINMYIFGYALDMGGPFSYNLINIDVDENNKNYSSENGIL